MININKQYMLVLKIIIVWNGINTVIIGLKMKLFAWFLYYWGHFNTEVLHLSTDYIIMIYSSPISPIGKWVYKGPGSKKSASSLKNSIFESKMRKQISELARLG